MHLIEQFFYELRKEKMRMFLTIIAICWGSANVVLMLSVGEGLHRQLSAGMTAWGDRMLVTWGGNTKKAYGGFPSGRWIPLREEDIPMILQQVPEIEAISAEYRRGGSISSDERDYNASLAGVYPCYGWMRNIFPDSGGRFINDLDQRNKRRVIVLGNAVRDNLFPNGGEIGKTILYENIPFLVIGTMKEKLQTACYNGNDDGQVFIPASTFRALWAGNRMDNIVMAPRTDEDAKAAEQGFIRAMAAKYRFDPTDDKCFWLLNSVEIGQNTKMVTRGIQIFIGIIGALTLLIAGIGVANIMYVAVKERTREIGIKMAVGARPGIIISQFVAESLLTVGIGGVLGVGLALGLVEIIKNLPLQEEVMQFIGKPVFSAMLALICTTFLGLIGLMAGIFPARRASSVDPVEALRYE